MRRSALAEKLRKLDIRYKDNLDQDGGAVVENAAEGNNDASQWTAALLPPLPPLTKSTAALEREPSSNVTVEQQSKEAGEQGEEEEEEETTPSTLVTPTEASVLPPHLQYRLEASRRRRSQIMETMAQIEKDSADDELETRLREARLQRRRSTGASSATKVRLFAPSSISVSASAPVTPLGGGKGERSKLLKDGDGVPKTPAAELGAVFVHALKDRAGIAAPTPRTAIGPAPEMLEEIPQETIAVALLTARPPAMPRFSAFRPDIRPILPFDIAVPSPIPRMFVISSMLPVELQLCSMLNPADAYVFLSHDEKPDSDFTVRMWIGPNAEADKRFVCAHTAVGLKAALSADGHFGAIQIVREDPGDESPGFLELFPDGTFELDEGPGTPSGLAVVDVGPGDYRRFRGNKPDALPSFVVYQWANGRLNHVAPVLNSRGGAVYVIDLAFSGIIVYCAQGAESSKDQLQASIIAASRMLSIDHGGDGTVWVLQEAWRDYAVSGGLEEQGWTLLDRLGIDVVDGVPNEADSIVFGDRSTVLYRFEGTALDPDPARNVVALATSRSIPSGDLLGTSNTVALIDSGTELFLHFGRRCSEQQKKLGMALLAKVVPLRQRPRWTDVRVFKEGAGPTCEAFRQKFAKWIDSTAYDPLKALKPLRDPPMIDWAAMEADQPPAPEAVDLRSVISYMSSANIYMQSFAAFVFDERQGRFVHRADRRPFGLGKLWDRESCVFLCTYQEQEQEGRRPRMVCTAYVWYGRHAPKLARAAFQHGTKAELTEAISKGFGAALQVVEMRQGREPEELLAHFGGCLVTLPGTEASWEERTRDRSKSTLMRLTATANGVVRATEVNPRASSLVSRECFLVLPISGRSKLWIGRGASIAERAWIREAARRILGSSRVPPKEDQKYLVASQEPSAFHEYNDELFEAVVQGREKEDFWNCFEEGIESPFDGSGYYFSQPPRFFGISCGRGFYESFEPSLLQSSLSSSDCAILDAGDPSPLRIWVGKASSPCVRRWARLAAERWLDKLNDGRWFAETDLGQAMGFGAELLRAKGNKRRGHGGVVYEIDGEESAEFRAFFSDWDQQPRSLRVLDSRDPVQTDIKWHPVVVDS